MSLLQNSGWMSGNPTLRPFSGWNEVHGGSMDRIFTPKMGQSGEANRRSRVLQEAHMYVQTLAGSRFDIVLQEALEYDILLKRPWEAYVNSTYY